ncbi:MAG: DHH family phosphoesterase [candidate division SR1 bacterium]|nr:DHH family phosphoesterase [candidate division SR1 bacterium]
MKPNTTKLHKLFQTSKNIALFGHTSPDGDCIGSMLGLGKILEKQGKRISYFTPTIPSKLFGFLPDIKKIKTTFDYKTYDLIVFVDFSTYDRIDVFAKNKDYFDKNIIVVIDHHPGNPPKHALAHKDIKAMSTSEIIFELAQKLWKKHLDKTIATYFYLGLVTDSGNFLFDENHERIFSNALALVKLGADKTLINNNIIRQKSLNQIKFLGILINRIQIKGDILYCYYEQKELKKYNIDEEEAGYGLVVIQNIQGPRLIIMFKKLKEYIKCSLRTNDTIPGQQPIDCNLIAKQFGGGGHPGAAGCSFPNKGNLTTLITSVVTQINKSLKK